MSDTDAIPKAHAGVDDLKRLLDDAASADCLRVLRPCAGTGTVIEREGLSLINCSSNDYLGLSQHPGVRAAACAAVERWGTGATASRLMSGHLELHESLERELAVWTGQESALLFGSGFLTNLGVLSALVGRGDVIYEDRLNHASLIDGARLSGARLLRYRHNDPVHLDELLTHHGARGRPALVVTDSVFSMDGDIAPLAEVSAVCERHGARLIVDEAHAVGVLGREGGGCCRNESVAVHPFAVVGTLSKALASYGGFVAGPRLLREVLVNRARPFMYSTGLAPACVGAAQAALGVIRGAGGELGRALLSRTDQFRRTLQERGLNTADSCSQVVPVVLGSNRRADEVSGALEREGVLCTAIRPPTVPEGTARLRFSVTLGHSVEVLAALAVSVQREVQRSAAHD